MESSQRDSGDNQPTKGSIMNASIYSTNGSMAYQLGDRRVLVQRNTIGGTAPIQTYQTRKSGEWVNTLYQRGVQPLIDKVKSAVAA